MPIPPNPPLVGVAEPFRPVVDLDGNKSFWDILHTVNAALKSKGLYAQAEEFRGLAQDECEGDKGMLIMLAFAYIKLPDDRSMTHGEDPNADLPDPTS